jgi:hypothetical protein
MKKDVSLFFVGGQCSGDGEVFVSHLAEDYAHGFGGYAKTLARRFRNLRGVLALDFDGAAFQKMYLNYGHG